MGEVLSKLGEAAGCSVGATDGLICGGTITDAEGEGTSAGCFASPAKLDFVHPEAKAMIIKNAFLMMMVVVIMMIPVNVNMFMR